MSQQIADAAARERALDARSSFIVQAPAGSGKTELLTQRLLVLLAQVEEPEEVVAITFTRKAAAEMRSRVFKAIRAAAAQTPVDNPHQRRTRELAAAVLARSHQRQWGIENNPQRLRVLTIDALCMQIAQQMPLAAGFGGRVRIAEEPQPLYRAAARATLSYLDREGTGQQALRIVLPHFDNRLGALEAQLVELLARRDQWLHFATESGRAAREELEAALREVIELGLQRAQSLLGAELCMRWLESAAYASSQRYAAEPQLELHSLRTGIWPGVRAETLAQWRALQDLVLTRDGKWRDKIDARLGFPAGKTAAEKRECKPPRDAHLALIAQLQEIDGLQEALLALRSLPAPCYEEAQWQVLQALLDLLRLASGELRLAFAARGEVDFAEVAAQAVHALGQEDAPSELALALDYRIRHLLVDEFQDTSRLQYELLLRLTAGWQPDDGRSLFVVGDPMQSIYRFREADVGLYLDVRRQGLGALHLEPLQLQCNFRSDGGVVDWLNRHFPQVLPAQEDRERSAVAYSAAIATRAAAPEAAVHLHALPGGDAREEARAVLALIRAQREADAQASIAVLVRSRTHLDELVPALRAAGLAYQAVDLESLASRPVIEDLRALTRALLHPADRIAWLALLRAPYCGLRLAELLALCEDLPPQASLRAALQEEARLARLSAEARARLGRCLLVLDETLAQAGRKPLRRWVESAWLALGGPAVLREPRDLADAQQFFACLEQLAPGPQLDDFERLDLALHKLKATPDPSADERLSLMTMHKAKGLEFDVVIVPGLSRTTRSDSRPSIIYSRRISAAREQLLLAPVQARGQEREPIYEYIRAREAEKQRIEDARLLYVAATRARRQLHLLAGLEQDEEGQARAPAPSSLLSRLWPALGAQFAAQRPDASPQAQPPASSEDRPAPPPLRRLHLDWQAPPLPAGLPVPERLASQGGEPRFDWAGETARAVGTVFHRWVECLAQQGLANWDALHLQRLGRSLPQEFAGLGLPPASAAAASAQVLNALRELLADPRGRWLFDPGHRQAFSEWQLSTVEDGELRQYRIDRSFIDAHGQRWVVDFKTSRHEGGELAQFIAQERERYRAQLAGYARLLREYGAEPVRAALYLPLIEDREARWQELDAGA
ncbi:ATP-dependent exoDNAse (exonuclease V) beta subunit (contains helicase and exonuclease domains) [Solimonas aquatica]|uniref:DNA 3'-5' helicase n=1 Tax=Solimonas aquatica TaxID=489703 RepID=A0A1H9H519_9GAMM|nr:UvrD-helicase domain-containing protein [Solimonas aquatica]SEQ57328.1 ATP-dependent exoDNAse (exonuclease V) beta subunit (contains helicase and exonuclease domains) [Solimonas aquatica]